MLCPASECGKSPDSRCCWQYCWCWLAVAAVCADNHMYKVWLAVLFDAWCITVHRVVRAHAMCCVVDRTVLEQRRRTHGRRLWRSETERSPTSHTMLIRATNLSNQVTLKQFIKLTFWPFEIVYLVKSFKYWSRPTQSAGLFGLLCRLERV